MLALTSNIGRVRATLTRIANALPQHIATAFNPSLYESNIREGVRAILAESEFLSDNEKDSAIPILLDSIKIENGTTPNSLIISMGGMSIWAARRDAVKVITEGDIALETVKDWVRAGREGQMGPDGEPIGKRLDGRDVDAQGNAMSDDEIARHVFFEMKRDPENWFGTTEDGHGALNPSGIVAFGSFTNIDPSENQARALMLVLNYLRRWVIDTFPELIVWRIQTAIKG